MTQPARATMFLPEPWVPLDFSTPPEPPQWLVRDFLARKRITMVHGREGSGKSSLYQTLIGSAMAGQPWLDRDVSAIQRIMVVDEENASDEVIARLCASGYDHERDRDRLLYFNLIGTQIGAGDWTTHLLDVADQFRPDLVIIDSMFAATTGTWQNETIMPLFLHAFRPLVNRFDCGLWLTHHNNKATGASVEDSASGGVAWLAQVDRQIGVTKLATGAQERESDGTVRLGFPMRLVGGKSRQGRSLPETFVSLESEATKAEPDLWTRAWLDVVPPPADADDEAPIAAQCAEAMLDALEREPGLSYNALCRAVGRTVNGTTRRALDGLIDSGQVRVEREGQRQRHYLPGDQEMMSFPDDDD